MSNGIERPIFFEGQILGAADLTAAVEYHSGQGARHNRKQHLWGIVDGLEMDGAEDSNTDGVKYKNIQIKPGSAVDKTGREIVVTKAEPLDTSLFTASNVVIADPEALYPVFLAGRNEPAPQQPFSIGACSQPQPTREIESFEISFGRPSDALDINPLDTSDAVDGDQSESRVLLGFVKWNATIRKFTDAVYESSGVTRRYAGVQADVVAARGGRLSLRSRSREGTPAISIDEKDEKQMLRFGMLTDKGLVKPVFWVSANGDVRAEGTIEGASVQVQSGIATDGTVLPLPPGITEDDVINDKVALHTQVSPRFPGSAPPDASLDWIAAPLECSIDAATRRVVCRFRWFRLGAVSPHHDIPGACNYTVMASVPPASGGSAPAASGGAT